MALKLQSPLRGADPSPLTYVPSAFASIPAMRGRLHVHHAGNDHSSIPATRGRWSKGKNPSARHTSIPVSRGRFVAADRTWLALASIPATRGRSNNGIVQRYPRLSIPATRGRFARKSWAVFGEPSIPVTQGRSVVWAYILYDTFNPRNAGQMPMLPTPANVKYPQSPPRGADATSRIRVKLT